MLAFSLSLSLSATALAARKTEKAAGKVRRAGMLQRAEKYVAEYRETERRRVTAKRSARAAGSSAARSCASSMPPE